MEVANWQSRVAGHSMAMKADWKKSPKVAAKRRGRTLRLERLESRELLAGDLQFAAQYDPDAPPIMDLATVASRMAAKHDTPVSDDLLTQLALATAETNALAAGEGFAFAPPIIDPTKDVLTDGEVEVLLERAAAASASEDAIIAIVDRSGNILGVRTEAGVVTTLGADLHKLVFAIDGAVAKARTAAFFASNEAPLTSRTIRNLSQSTVTQREVESNPTLLDPSDTTNNNPFNPAQPSSLTFGPGFVAPIGVGGHFPQGIAHTPPVDLFGIERQSRDSLLMPGLDGVKGTPDDIVLTERFNIDPADLAPGAQLTAPESYGYSSGLLSYAQSRGIATLPGGLPIYKVVTGDALPTLVGGIGVFFPGPDGYATYEQNFKHASTLPRKKPQTNEERLNAPKVLEAEWIAYAAVGGIQFFNPKSPNYYNGRVGVLDGVAPLPNFGLPFGRIDLVGIQLEVYGPNPSAKSKLQGFETLIQKGRQVGQGDKDSGANQPLDVAGNTLAEGVAPTDGWIVMPHASPTGASTLTAADVTDIVMAGIDEANLTRAAIRLDLNNIKNGLPQPGARTKMVFAVTDREGNVLGLYRMPDATIFSIDVAVAKGRNTAYYANPALLQDADKVDDNLLLAAGVTNAIELKKNKAPVDSTNNHSPDLYTSTKNTTKYSPLTGLAFTNRTFRFLAEPRYPAGVDGSLPPIFSSLNTLGVNRNTAENSPPLSALAPPASNFFTVLGYNAFHVGRNFQEAEFLDNQNGVVFFPGSTPLYVGAGLQGGFGVSGDGVDQDDVVTFAGQQGFAPPTALRVDNAFYRSVRLPFQKFSRNPRA